MVRLKSNSAANPGKEPKMPEQALTPQQRRHYIEVAAYYVAERRGFCDGDAMADWIAAEQEIDRGFICVDEIVCDDGFVAEMETFPEVSEGKAS